MSARSRPIDLTGKRGPRREVDFRGSVTWEQHYGKAYRARVENAKKRAVLRNRLLSILLCFVAIFIVAFAYLNTHRRADVGPTATNNQRFVLVSGDRYDVCTDFVDSLDSNTSDRIGYEWPVREGESGVSKPHWQTEPAADKPDILRLFLLSHLRSPGISDTDGAATQTDDARILADYWPPVRQLANAGRILLAHTVLDFDGNGMEADLYRLSPADFAIEKLRSWHVTYTGASAGSPWIYLALPRGTGAAPRDLIEYRTNVTGQYDSILYHEHLFLIGRNFDRDRRLDALWSYVLAPRQEGGLGAKDEFALLEIQSAIGYRPTKLYPLCIVADQR